MLKEKNKKEEEGGEEREGSVGLCRANDTSPGCLSSKRRSPSKDSTTRKKWLLESLNLTGMLPAPAAKKALKGLETGSFDKREPAGSFDKREPAATSSASLAKKEALDVPPLQRTPRGGGKAARTGLPLIGLTQLTWQGAMECLQRMWRHSRSCIAMDLTSCS